MKKIIAKIIKQNESREFWEGRELCREYVRTSKLWFGSSTLEVGENGTIDTGHPISEEVFFCAKGHVKIFDGNQYYELKSGDALLIPENLPHTLFNIGEEIAIVVWAGAPGE